MDGGGKKFSIIGGGVSGQAAARLLRRHGAEVFVSEKSDSPEKRAELKALSDAGIEWESGRHSTDRTVDADAIILSPGVTPGLPVLLAALKRDVPIYSEIEVAFWFCKSPIAAVSGTNGKTTVTTLIGEIFRKAGKKVAVAGNIGTPFSDVVDRNDGTDFFVIELSSYQLERIATFRAHIAVLLNITPDHLERYRSIDEYVETKFRITLNQTGNDYFVYNQDDPEIRWLAKNVKSRHVSCSLEAFGKSTVGIDGENICVNNEGGVTPLLGLADIRIPGKHNIHNVMESAAAAFAGGVSPGIIAEAVREFRGIEHRIELVDSLEGRSFYNDSKGTNVDAACVALEAVAQPIIWIAGGRDKKSDLAPLCNLIRSKVRLVILIGEAADRMQEAWQTVAAEIARASSLEEAVRTAWERSHPGDTILLSPACSSFDMFRNFEERGEVFKTIVRSIADKIKSGAR